MPHHAREEVRGVYANHRLLAYMHDVIGREVIVDTRDGQRYEGIFMACSPEFEIGLKLAHPLPSDGTKKLLPHVNEVVEKLQFDCSDVVCVTAVMQDEKVIRGFATDREYQMRRNGTVDAAELLSDLNFEEWEADGEEELELDDRSHAAKNARIGQRGTGEGWSADEMFRTNKVLGVKSTFDENLSQYTTAEVEENSDARVLADKIAREIEKNPASRTNAMLENDDEERSLEVSSYAAGTGAAADGERGARLADRGAVTDGDRGSAGRGGGPPVDNDDDERGIDKTAEFHAHTHRKGNPTTGRNSYTGGTRGGGVGGSGSTRNTSQLSNRRPEGGLQGGGKGRGGSYGSGGSTSRSFMNSSLSHGGKGSGGSQSGGGYSTSSGRYQTSMERSATQAVHGDVSQWSEMRRGGGEAGPNSVGGGGPKGAQGRRAEPSAVSSSSAMPSSKVYESSSHRGHHNANSPLNRSVEETRGGHHAGSPHGTGSSSPSVGGGKGSAGGPSPGGASRGGTADRYKVLRDFQTNFDSAYQPNSQRSHSTHSSVDDDQSGASTATSVTTTASTPVNNAWHKGPPLSVRSPASAAPSQPNAASPKEPTPAESAAHISEHAQGAAKVKGHPVSVSSPSSGSQTTASSCASVDSSHSSSSSEQTPRRVHSASGSDQTIVPMPKTSPLPQPASTSSMQPTQTVIVGSSTDTSIASIAGSSSSIAPTDPTPSMSSVSLNDASSTTTTIGKKSDYSLPEKGKKFEFNPDAPPFTPRSASSHLGASQSVVTSQPLMSGPHSTPVPLQAIPINTPQGLSLAQGMQPGGMVAHAGPPQVFPYAAGTSVYTVPVYYGPQAMAIQAGTQLAQSVGANTAAASVAGGPIVTGAGGMSVARGSQVSAGTPTARRPQQQQVLQGGGVYVPGQALPYPQQMIQQYQMPFYAAAAPYQQLSMAAANVPPPSVPPPTSSAVGVPGAQPQPFQVIQTQAQHPQAAYSRQFYQQGGQPSMNYMVAAAAAAAPRYAQPHQAVDYNGGGAQQQASQASQQPSSAASSNGNSSNGQNSQPATPGPQPVASPAQMAYPLSGTPQSPHTVVLPVAHAAAPPHHPQHMFVHPSAQFPFMSAGSTGYMMYSPAHQTMMQFPGVATPVNLGQAHGQVHHQQHVALEHYQNSSEPQSSQQSNQNLPAPSSVPPQQFISSDQSFGQYVHTPQGIYHQQQGVNVAVVRQNSLGGSGGGVPPGAQHSFQSASVASQSGMN